MEQQTDTTAALRRAAEAGEPKAQFALAQRVRDAATGTEDLQEYADLLQAAAEQGHSHAMLQLSQAYALGGGSGAVGRRVPTLVAPRRGSRQSRSAGQPAPSPDEHGDWSMRFARTILAIAAVAGFGLTPDRAAAETSAACFEVPEPIVSLSYGSRYTDDSKDRSDIDKEADAAVDAALEPIDDLIVDLAKGANTAVEEKRRRRRQLRGRCDRPMGRRQRHERT
ncbi:hypothetical protein QW131_30965 [Roseibium salinum]|nr:hypothetical protein [Roseibium salinum]